jgi:hypothetical protein
VESQQMVQMLEAPALLEELRAGQTDHRMSDTF